MANEKTKTNYIKVAGKILIVLAIIAIIVFGVGSLVKEASFTKIISKITGMNDVFAGINKLKESIKIQEEYFNKRLEEKQKLIDKLETEIGGLRDEIIELDQELLIVDEELKKKTASLWYKINNTQQKLEAAKPKDVVNEWEKSW